MFRIYSLLLLFWLLISFSVFFVFESTNSLLTYVSDLGQTVVSDFVVFHAAGSLIRTQPVDVYDCYRFSDYVNRHYSATGGSALYQVQYPPHFLLIFAALSLLPVEPAWYLWSFIGLLLAFFSAVLITADDKNCWKKACILYIFLLSSFPAWICVRTGQFSFLFLFALSVFCFLLRKNLKVPMALILPLIKMQYLPSVLVTGTTFGRSSFFYSSALTALFLSFISILSIGWKNFLAIPSAILRHQTNSQFSGAVPGIMQNFRGFLVCLSGADNSIILAFASAVLLFAILLLVYLWMKLYPSLMKYSSNAAEICFSITVLLMLISSLNTYVYDYVALLIPCFFLFKWTSFDSEFDAISLRVLILCLPIFSWLCSPILFNGNPLRFVPPPLFVWALIVLVICLYRIKKLSAGEKADLLSKPGG